MTIFVYEDVCATAGGDRESPPASLLAEGRAMRDAVTADFLSIPDMQVLSPGEPGASATGAGASATGAGAQTPFARLASIADYTLVIAPESSGRLEQLANEVLRAGGRLLGPSPDGIRLAADKLALARHWEAHGVPTPRTWPLGEAPSDRALVVKPRDGAGSQDVALFPSGWEDVRARPRCASASPGGASASRQLLPLPTFAERSSILNAFIAQEFIPGFAASVAFLIGPRTIAPLVPCAQHLSTDGRFQYRGGQLPIRADLAERAVRIAMKAVRCVPGLLGFVGVDLVLGDDGRDWAIEINPRLTTSYVGLRALARDNLAEAMLAAVRGDPFQLRWRDQQVSFTPDGQVSAVEAPAGGGEAPPGEAEAKRG
jgi:hypothetical protein